VKHAQDRIGELGSGSSHSEYWVAWELEIDSVCWVVLELDIDLVCWVVLELEIDSVCLVVWELESDRTQPHVVCVHC